MSNKVTFQIKIEGENELRTVTVDAKELGQAFSAVQAEVKNLKGEVVTLASTFELLQGASDVVSQLKDTLSGFVAEFQEDDLAESRLAQAMRNTMDASDDEIQSIKALAEAQERLGVVSAGVQLSAAQELATYLEYSDSLKTILPVMNDMVAQQLGIGASAESATQIATMLGKVMNGQTEALSRYGYKFDDAQKYILQFGDESERAAVLAEVVEQSVAGMNEALAQTPSGAIAQAKNEIDGMKAAIGKVVSGFMPLISALSDITLSALGVAKLTKAIKALHLETAVAKVKTVALAAAQRSQAAAARILGISQTQAAAATGVLRAEVIALQAAMTFGLAAAISLVIGLLAKLFSKSGDAAEGLEEVNRAEDAYRRASADARAETAADIVALEDLIKAKGQEGEKVEELNRKYGDAFGTYSSAAEWYDILTSKSKEYCQQLAYEALAVEYKEELAEALKNLDEAEKKRDSTQKYKQEIKIDRVASEGDPGAYHFEETDEVTAAWIEADAAVAEAEKSVEDLTASMGDAVKKASELAESLKKSGEQTAVSWKTMNLADLEKAIQDQKGLVESLAGGSDSGAAKAAAAELKQMETRAKALKDAYGLDTSATDNKGKYDGSKLIENAASYKELGNNIKYYQNKLEEANGTDAEAVKQYAQEIQKLQQMQSILKDAADAEALPMELNTLEDIDQMLTYLNSHRKKVSAENLADVDATIERLTEMRDKMEEDAAPKPKSTGEISTYKELEEALSYYQGRMKSANEAERAQIQATINELNKKKDAWEAAAQQKPADVSSLNTIDELEEALSYYQERQQSASASEIANIQTTINELNKKKSLLEGLASISDMQNEVSGLNAASTKQDFMVELKLIGLDEVQAKVRSLKKMLQEPFYKDQQDELKSLLGTYKSYEKILKTSNLTFAEGWSDIKGMVNSVKSLTETLNEDSTAWEKVSGVIDTVLALYQTFSQIIEIIKMLTSVTEAHAVAKQVEGTAEMTEAGQAAAAGAQNIATNEAVSASNGARTTTNVAVAGSGFLAAHSSIPFVGIALGAAMVASMIALMMSLPKFADGGIAYGTTLGIFGEYAGAANNPEVVAPLDRLKSLIGSDDSRFAPVSFKIRGRDLIGLLQKEQRISSRVD
jgi:hypothetical protein